MLATGLAFGPGPSRAQSASNAEYVELRRAAAALLARGEFESASKLLERACPRAPDDDACVYDAALATWRAGRPSAARDALKRRLEAGESADLLNLLGAVEEALGELDAAARSLQRAAELEPNERNVFDLGAFLLKYDSRAAALTILEYGARRHPDSARMLTARGVALHAAGRHDEAIETLCRAVDLDPADARPLTFLSEIFDTAPEQAELVTARLARFAEAHPESAPANYYYAMSLWKASRRDADAPLDRVEELLRKALAVDPEHVEARYQLGLLLERRERPAEARREYEAAVAAKPDFAEAHYRLGLLLRGMGEIDAAEQSMAAYERLKKRALDGENAN